MTPIYVVDFDPGPRPSGDLGEAWSVLETETLRENRERTSCTVRQRRNAANARRAQRLRREARALGYSGPLRKATARLVRELQEAKR